MNKKTGKNLILILIVLLLPAISLTHYALYDISGIRKAVGKVVVLPEKEANEHLDRTSE